MRLTVLSALLSLSVVAFAACDGAAGSDGPQGPTGASGGQGEIGSQGPAGEKGGTGEKGAIGSAGTQGEAGAVGATGPAGSSAGVEAGDGLTLTDDVIAADLAGTGSATSISRSDHDHDAEYYGLSAVDAAIAASSDWAALTSVPVDIADGDADTLASLSCTNGQSAKYTSGSWACGSSSGGAADGGINAITNLTTLIDSPVATGQNIAMEIGIDGFPFLFTTTGTPV